MTKNNEMHKSLTKPGEPAISSIDFRDGDKPGARYISGAVVFDEGFTQGRLCTRYWNPNGQVWPEMYYGKTTWPVD